MKKYRVKLVGGGHVEGGVEHKSGTTFVSDRPLHQAFSDKFELLEEFDDDEEQQPQATEQAPAAKSEESEEEEDTQETTQQKEEEETDWSAWNDVTGDFFEDPENAAVTVYEKAHWYNVVDADGQKMNDKGLREDDVEKFLDELDV